MEDPVTFFFEEVWLHRRNKFIAVGGVALFLLFIAIALQPIPWVPNELKQAMMYLAGASLFATMLLMAYYALKFVSIGFVWIFKKAFHLSRDKDHEKLDL